jgi:hypothetical protein
MMHGAFWIVFLDKRVRRRGPLLTFQYVEVIIRGMSSRVSFRTQRCSKDDQILGDTGVYNVHGAHCPTRIIEHPFIGQRRDLVGIAFGLRESRVGVKGWVSGEWIRGNEWGMTLAERGGDVMNDTCGGIRVEVQSFEYQRV